MKLPLIGVEVDERFLAHRRRSTSNAGIASAVLALLLFLWYDLVRHDLRWDLLAVGLAFVVVKLVLLAWYRFTD